MENCSAKGEKIENASDHLHQARKNKTPLAEVWHLGTKGAIAKSTAIH
jgi:hypothetical protein